MLLLLMMLMLMVLLAWLLLLVLVVLLRVVLVLVQLVRYERIWLMCSKRMVQLVLLLVSAHVLELWVVMEFG